MTDLVPFTEWFTCQHQAVKTGDKTAFTQAYFLHMRERAVRVRVSGKCPYLFKLTVEGIDIDLLETLWYNQGFTLRVFLRWGDSHWLLVARPDFTSPDPDTMLWYDSLVVNYRHWYEKRLRHLLKQVSRLALGKNATSPSFSCECIDQIFTNDLTTIISCSGFQVVFVSVRDTKWMMKVQRK